MPFLLAPYLHLLQDALPGNHSGNVRSGAPSGRCAESAIAATFPFCSYRLIARSTEASASPLRPAARCTSASVSHAPARRLSMSLRSQPATTRCARASASSIRRDALRFAPPRERWFARRGTRRGSPRPRPTVPRRSRGRPASPQRPSRTQARLTSVVTPVLLLPDEDGSMRVSPSDARLTRSRREYVRAGEARRDLEVDDRLARRNLRRCDVQVGQVLGEPRCCCAIRLLGARLIVEDADRRRAVAGLQEVVGVGPVDALDG